MKNIGEMYLEYGPRSDVAGNISLKKFDTFQFSL